VSFTQRKSEFEKWIPADRPAIEMAALDFLSCENCLWMQEWPECDCWIYVFKLKHFVRHDYPYFYDKFDDRILRIPRAEFCHSVAHVCL
jgi:hypothetical protein